MARKWVVMIAVVLGLAISLLVFYLQHLVIKPAKMNVETSGKIMIVTLILGCILYGGWILAGFLMEFRKILGSKEYFKALGKSLIFGIITTTILYGSAYWANTMTGKTEISVPAIFFMLIFISSIPMNGMWNPLKKVGEQKIEKAKQ